MKKGIFCMMLSGLLLLSASAMAGQYEQRVITTTTLIGATAGAVIGSAQNQTAQGAIVGGLLGALTGAVISQNHPQQLRADYDDDREHEWREQRRRAMAHRRHEWREHERREHRRAERLRVAHARHCYAEYGCPDYRYDRLQRASYRHYPTRHWYED